MEFYTADTYKNWERLKEPYDKKGKLYTIVKTKCDRCTNGIYAVGVENGHIKPHPAYGGVCLKCGGRGFLTKEVRLYTEKEYNSMKKSAATAKAKKEQQRKEEMEREFDHKKEVWLATNGFSPEGITYVITGDSYSIKDELKNAGFKYDVVLRWHRASAEGYEDRVIKIDVNDVIEFSAWGEGHYKTGSKDIVDKLLLKDLPQENSEWIGTVGEKYPATKVTIVKKASFSGRFGLTNVFTFKDAEGNLLTWFTTKIIPFEIGTPLILKGTIKDHSEYKDVKNTVLTRCTFKEVG